jgi:hypothetical protein
MPIRVFVSRGSVRAESHRGRRIIAAAEAPWESPAELAERVAELAAMQGFGGGGDSIHVRINAPVAQVRRLEGLPPVPNRALRPLVELRAAHYFRRNGVPLVVDARWVGRRRPGRHALAAGAPATVIAALLEGARQAGHSIGAIEAGRVDGARLDLLPVTERAYRVRRGLVRAAMAATLGVGLCLSAGAVLGVRLARADRAAAVELREFQPAMDALASLHEMVNRADSAVHAVDAAAARRGERLGAVLRAAGALPDSAYLVSAEVDSAGAGRLGVVAPRAIGVVAALERAGISNPRLDGEPVTVHQDGIRRERFTLRFGTGQP